MTLLRQLVGNGVEMSLFLVQMYGVNPFAKHMKGREPVQQLTRAFNSELSP